MENKKINTKVLNKIKTDLNNDKTLKLNNDYLANCYLIQRILKLLVNIKNKMLNHLKKEKEAKLNKNRKEKRFHWEQWQVWNLNRLEIEEKLEKYESQRTEIEVQLNIISALTKKITFNNWKKTEAEARKQLLDIDQKEADFLKK